MAKRVVWSKPATADRISILDYWLRRTNSKRYSSKLNKDIKRIVGLLSRFPGLGRRFDDREERFFIVDHYLIVYFEAPDVLEILHVWDSRRNPDDLVL